MATCKQRLLSGVNIIQDCQDLEDCQGEGGRGELTQSYAVCIWDNEVIMWNIIIV